MDLNEDFRALAIAAMSVSTRILGTLNGDQAEAVQRAVSSGSRLVLEFGPLPAFESAVLYLVEHEGKRHRLGDVKRAAGPLKQDDQ